MDAVDSNAETRLDYTYIGVYARMYMYMYIYIKAKRGGRSLRWRVGEPFRAYGTSPRVSKELRSIAPSH